MDDFPVMWDGNRSGLVQNTKHIMLLDQTAGMVARPNEPGSEDTAIATLDLRIDYMGPATPGEDLWATGECYKRTRNIAFIRAWAFHETKEDPVATCVAAFMMGTPNTPRPPA